MLPDADNITAAGVVLNAGQNQHLFILKFCIVFYLSEDNIKRDLKEVVDKSADRLRLVQHIDK
jgi:hypothetical protein